MMIIVKNKVKIMMTMIKITVIDYGTTIINNYDKKVITMIIV